MDVQSDQVEQFRQFQAVHIERQTKAQERQARDVSAIRAIITVWMLLTVLGALVFAALASSAAA